ncbi:hypothetical protein [Chelativorans xinjiangense]|uniref:hypothetical protein n=1 Tax=Chelativorans xinjiangense TaxID=2681485 RepID=UPI00135C96D4|nr:hypothetical protein [Chelativorans xinjiangense]
MAGQHETHNDALGQSDFRVSYSKSTGWLVAIVTREAHLWARQNANSAFFSNNGDHIITDLAGVNLLVRNARNDGLRTEYIGPHRLVRF